MPQRVSYFKNRLYHFLQFKEENIISLCSVAPALPPSISDLKSFSLDGLIYGASAK